MIGYVCRKGKRSSWQQAACGAFQLWTSYLIALIEYATFVNSLYVKEDRKTYNYYIMQHPTVFVTQIPVRKDPTTKELVPGLNISPAQEYGSIEILAPSQVGFSHIPSTIEKFEDLLCSYDEEQGDCLLPLGDSVLVAIATGILAWRGVFSVLKWDKNVGRYFKTKIDFDEQGFGSFGWYVSD